VPSSQFDIFIEQSTFKPKAKVKSMKGHLLNIARFACFRNDPSLEKIDEAMMTKILNNEPIGGYEAAPAGGGGGNNNPPPVVPPATPPATPPPGTPPVTPPAGAGTPPVVPPAGGAQPFDLTTWLDGRYKDIKDVERDISLVPTLQQQLSEAQSKIPSYSEKVQKAIDFANQYSGMEDEAAARYLQVQRLDVSKLSDQQLRFEAFKLDPKYANLAEDKQRIVFNGQEIGLYGDPSKAETPQTDYQKTLQELATDEAKRKITGLQEEYRSAKGAQPTPEELARDKETLRSTVQQQLSNFGGIPFKFSVLNEKGEKQEGAMNYTIKPEELKILIEAVSDPLGQWDKILEQRGVFSAETGEPDRVKFGQIFSRLIFQEQIDNQIYKQGWDDMLAYLVKTHRNPGAQGGGAGGAASTPEGSGATEIEKVAAAFAKMNGLV
jgi:hypothetical protein